MGSLGGPQTPNGRRPGWRRARRGLLSGRVQPDARLGRGLFEAPGGQRAAHHRVRRGARGPRTTRRPALARGGHPAAACEAAARNPRHPRLAPRAGGFARPARRARGAGAQRRRGADLCRPRAGRADAGHRARGHAWRVDDRIEDGRGQPGRAGRRRQRHRAGGGTHEAVPAACGQHGQRGGRRRRQPTDEGGGRVPHWQPGLRRGPGLREAEPRAVFAGAGRTGSTASSCNWTTRRPPPPWRHRSSATSA